MACVCGCGLKLAGNSLVPHFSLQLGAQVQNPRGQKRLQGTQQGCSIVCIPTNSLFVRWPGQDTGTRLNSLAVVRCRGGSAATCVLNLSCVLHLLCVGPEHYRRRPQSVEIVKPREQRSLLLEAAHASLARASNLCTHQPTPPARKLLQTHQQKTHRAHTQTHAAMAAGVVASCCAVAGGHGYGHVTQRSHTLIHT